MVRPDTRPSQRTTSLRSWQRRPSRVMPSLACHFLPPTKVPRTRDSSLPEKDPENTHPTPTKLGELRTSQQLKKKKIHFTPAPSLSRLHVSWRRHLNLPNGLSLSPRSDISFSSSRRVTLRLPGNPHSRQVPYLIAGICDHVLCVHASCDHDRFGREEKKSASRHWEKGPLSLAAVRTVSSS